MFLCRLSLAWGIPPTEIEQTVSAGDLDRMREYWSHEPWGPWRDNVHAGLVASTISRMFGGKATYSDFMLLDAETYERKRAENHRMQTDLLITYLKGVAVPKVKRG